jgi:putative transposase
VRRVLRGCRYDRAMGNGTAKMKYMDAALTAEIKIANVSDFCRVNGINRRTFYRHKARIEAEGSWQPRSRRPGTSPGQTPAEVEAEIIRLRGELGADNGADSILPALAGVAAREGWAERGLRVPARSTVNRVLTRAGLVEPAPAKRPRSSWRRFAYARPRDCYQVDATEVKLAGGGKAAVFDVLDDCTRLLAACVAAPSEDGPSAAAAIKAAAAGCGAPGIVLCDNGTAFSGGRARGQGEFARAVTGLGSRIIRSSPYHPQTCGKVERHHQTLKKWLAARPAPATLEELQALLDEYRDWYNTRRRHTAVKATPRQAWDSADSLGGPGHLPAQDDATVHKLTADARGSIFVGSRIKINLGAARARARVTAIRDHDRVTVYTRDGDPIGTLRIDHSKTYQGQLPEVA